MSARVFLAALCLALPVAGEKTQAQKEWALGAGAMPAQIGGARHDLLAGTENIATIAEDRRQTLLESWKVKSRQDLLAEIQALLRDDGESARIGWNYPQAINLARLGYGAGYLQEDEAWNVITPAAERLQKTFA